MEDRSSVCFKLVLLGEGRVGKSSLVLRFVMDRFSESQQSTVQASFLQKTVNVGRKAVTLSIWDTAGQERFHALGPIYYRDANAALLVYDTTDRESLAKVRDWVKELRKMCGADILIFIAGNKIDMPKERQVSEEEAKEFSASVGAAHFLTSAKLGKGVDAVFTEIAKELASRPALSSAPSRNRIRIVEEQSSLSNKSSSACC